MIDVPLDKFGNNLWTLAAENGTVKIMNYLINMLYSWPIQDLDCVLHYKTGHRERACIKIVEKVQTDILKQVLSDQEFDNFEKQVNSPYSNPTELREFLQALKKHLDTTINDLNNSIREMESFYEQKTVRHLRRTLVSFRKRLLISDLEWHHNSLTGIISKNYPPNCMIVQKIIELEIMCHEKPTLNELTSENSDQQNSPFSKIISCCLPNEHQDDNTIQLKSFCQNSNMTFNENSQNEELMPEPKEKENYLEANMAFLRCMYNRVGKSPCTVAALDMAGETYLPTKAMPEPKCSQIPSMLYFMLSSRPFWICLILFLFSFSLLVVDFTTDVILVVELYQNYTQNTSHNCIRNISQFNQTGLHTFGAAIFSPLFHQFFKNNMHAVFLATLSTVMLPFAGFVVLWFSAENLGLYDLKTKVS